MNSGDTTYELRWAAFHRVYYAGVLTESFAEAIEIFAEALGFSSWMHLAKATDHGDPMLHQKLHMLASPHGVTIWKAIKVRNK